MSDAALRRTERAAGADPAAAGAELVAVRLRTGAALADVANEAARAEPALRAAMIAELIRRGARDPRVDPRPWAWVESVGRYNGRHSSRVQREVVRLWPGRLAISLLAVPRAEWAPANGGPLGRSITLRPRTPVLSVTERTWRGLGSEREPETWLVVAEIAGEPGRYAEYVTTDCPEVYGPGSVLWSDLPELEVLAVEWEHRGSSPGRHPQRSTLEQWRRWARGGTVLQLDCETRGRS